MRNGLFCPRSYSPRPSRIMVSKPRADWHWFGCHDGWRNDMVRPSAYRPKQDKHDAETGTSQHGPPPRVLGVGSAQSDAGHRLHAAGDGSVDHCLSAGGMEPGRCLLHGGDDRLHRGLWGGAGGRHPAAARHHHRDHHVRLHRHDLRHRRAGAVHHGQSTRPDIRDQAHEFADRPTRKPCRYLRLRPVGSGACPGLARRRGRFRGFGTR